MAKRRSSGDRRRAALTGGAAGLLSALFAQQVINRRDDAKDRLAAQALNKVDPSVTVPEKRQGGFSSENKILDALLSPTRVLSPTNLAEIGLGDENKDLKGIKNAGDAERFIADLGIKDEKTQKTLEGQLGDVQSQATFGELEKRLGLPPGSLSGKNVGTALEGIKTEAATRPRARTPQKVTLPDGREALRDPATGEIVFEGGKKAGGFPTITFGEGGQVERIGPDQSPQTVARGTLLKARGRNRAKREDELSRKRVLLGTLDRSLGALEEGAATGQPLGASGNVARGIASGFEQAKAVARSAGVKIPAERNFFKENADIGAVAEAANLSAAEKTQFYQAVTTLASLSSPGGDLSREDIKRASEALAGAQSGDPNQRRAAIQAIRESQFGAFDSEAQALEAKPFQRSSPAPQPQATPNVQRGEDGVFRVVR